MIAKKYHLGFSLAGLLALVALTGPLCFAQTVCPIHFENVSSAGNASTSTYVMVFRNTTRFPIKGVVFKAAGDNAHTALRPALFVSHHLIAPGAKDSVIWNAAHLIRPGSTETAFTVWPSMVIFHDNSAWNSVTINGCSFRYSPAATTAENFAKPSQSSEGLTAAQKIALIDSGKASLCLVTTQPAGATVDVDGRRIGITPLKFVLLKRGSMPRSIDIYKDGYDVISRKLSPTGAMIRLNETLRPFSLQ